MTTQVHPPPEAPDPAAPTGAPAHTGSPATRVLGLVTLALLVVWAVLGLVASPADALQGEAVRLLYVHVPVVTVAYLSCLLATVASGLWLWKRTTGWDVLASSAVEIAAVFTAATLVSGAVWGGAAWGAYWMWDARLTSTALLFLLQLGYLALRRIPAAAELRARRAAILGLLLTPNIVIINQSVNWWRSIHQDATTFQASLSPHIRGIQFFAFGYSMVVGGFVFAWLLLHRFRVGYLAEKAEEQGLEHAIAQRRAEAGIGEVAS